MRKICERIMVPLFLVTLFLLNSVTGFANENDTVTADGLYMYSAGNYRNDSKTNVSYDTAYTLPRHTQSMEQFYAGNKSTAANIHETLTGTQERWYKISLQSSQNNYLTVNTSSTVPVAVNIYSESMTLINTFTDSINTMINNSNWSAAKIGNPHKLNTGTGTYYVQIVPTGTGLNGMTFLFNIGDPLYKGIDITKTLPKITLTNSIGEATTTFTLSASDGIPLNSKIYSIHSTGTSTGSSTGHARYIKRSDASSWTTLSTFSSSATTKLSPFQLAHGTWQFKLSARVSSTTTPYTYTPKLSIFVYFPIVPEIL